MSDKLTATPQHLLKPKLVWVGRILGMDLYLDIQGKPDAMKKRDVAERVLKKMFKAEEEINNASQ